MMGGRSGSIDRRDNNKMVEFLSLSFILFITVVLSWG